MRYSSVFNGGRGKSVCVIFQWKLNASFSDYCYWNAVNSGMTSFPAPTSEVKGKHQYNFVPFSLTLGSHFSLVVYGWGSYFETSLKWLLEELQQDLLMHHIRALVGCALWTKLSTSSSHTNTVKSGKESPKKANSMLQKRKELAHSGWMLATATLYIGWTVFITNSFSILPVPACLYWLHVIWFSWPSSNYCEQSLEYSHDLRIRWKRMTFTFIITGGHPL